MMTTKLSPLSPINILLQCTTKELNYIIRLMATLPRPYNGNKINKTKFIICSDIKFTEFESELIREISLNTAFHLYFDLVIENCSQTALTSIY